MCTLEVQYRASRGSYEKSRLESTIFSVSAVALSSAWMYALEQLVGPLALYSLRSVEPLQGGFNEDISRNAGSITTPFWPKGLHFLDTYLVLVGHIFQAHDDVYII